MTTASQDLDVRPATPDDDPAVLALLQASMGWVPDEQHRTFFEWKHRQGPFGPSPAWVACDGERIVGFRTFLRWQFVRDGRVVDAVRAVDTATHPDHQGRGIFSLLTRRALDELAEQGVAFVFNTPNARSRPGYLKMGWQLVGRLPVAARPRSLGALVRLARARTPADKWSADTTAGHPAPEVFTDEPTIAELLLGPSTGATPGGEAAGNAPAGPVDAPASPQASAPAAGGADAVAPDVPHAAGLDRAAGAAEPSNVRGQSDAVTRGASQDVGPTPSLDGPAGTPPRRGSGGSRQGGSRAEGSAEAGDGQGGLVTHRTPAYLRWRYGFPALRYRVITAPEGPAGGLVVFRLRRRGAATEAAICELLLPGEAAGDVQVPGAAATDRTARRGTSSRLARRLLGQVLRATRADHAVWLGAPRWDLGLLPLPKQGPTLVWRPTGTSDAVLPPPPLSDWDLTLGDIELF